MAIRAYKPKTLPRRWEVIWYEQSASGLKQKRKAGFETKGDALDFEAKRRRERLIGEHLIEPSLTTLDDYLDDWLESMSGLSAETIISRRNRVKPFRVIIGHVPISQLTSVQIEQAYARMRREGRTEVFVAKAHQAIKMALKRAVMHQMITTNPCDRVKAPSVPKPEVKTWKREQMQSFLRVNGNDERWGDFWSLLCETWLRVGEITDLRWGDIDLDAGTLTVSHSVKRDENYHFFSGSAKTVNAVRTIPLSATMVERFRRRKDASTRSGTRDLIFPGKGTHWLSSQYVGRILKSHCRRAGVPEIKVHEVRHSGGSIAYLNGVDIKTVSERLGHKTIAFTLATYAHTNEEHHRTAAEVIAGLLKTECEDLMSVAAD